MRWIGWAINVAKVNQYKRQGEVNMITYEDALSRYEHSKAPTRSAKWLSQPDSPRYLRNVSADHMGIHKTSDDAIYYRLYNTKVAIFYKPLPDGTRLVQTNYYDSQTTSIFMYENGLHYYDLITTEGKAVKVPYVPSWSRDTQQHTPSANLWFNAEGKLIVEKSDHKDIYTFKSSAEDKDKRKEFKKKVDVLMTLAMFRLPEYRANVTIDDDLGAPFGTAWRNKPASIDDFERTVHQLGSHETEHPQYIQSFLDMGQAVFDILSSKKVFNHVPEGQRWTGSLFHTWNLTTEQKDELIKQQHAIADQVTAEEFKKSLTTRLLDIASLKTGTVKTPWGQFMDTIPRKYYT